MKIIVGITLVFMMMGSWAFAEKLEIKVDNKTIQLPYWPSLKKAPNGGLLLVSNASNTQSSSFLESLAKQLAARGWSTVLLQQDAAFNKSWAEALNSLRTQNLKRVVALHYGEQLNQTLTLFDAANQKIVEGLIFLSAYDASATLPPKIKLGMPTLDLFGQFDYDPVKTQVESRQKAFSQNHYLAKQVPGASHDYTHANVLLISFLQGWLLQLPEFKRPTPPPTLMSYLEPVLIFFEQVTWDES